MIRVYVDMVADLFHVGHLNLLKKAKEEGDFLIVGIHSDETVKSYKRQPIIIEEQRYAIIKECRLVDKIIEDAPLIITDRFMKRHQIDIVVHGNDNNGRYKEQHKAPLEQGKMKYVNYTNGISTTKIISKILEKNRTQ